MPNDEDDICQNRHGGNEFSEAAHKKTDSKRDRKRIVAHLQKFAPCGLAAFQVEVQLSIPRSTVSARMSELKKMNAIFPTGERRDTGSGSTAGVWRYRFESDPPMIGEL